MNGIRRLVIVTLVMLMLSALLPKRAHAFDTTPLIISGASLGVALVIGLIAILVVGNEEDEELSPVMPRQSRTEASGQIRFAHDCPMTGDSRPLVCW